MLNKVLGQVHPEMRLSTKAGKYITDMLLFMKDKTPEELFDMMNGQLKQHAIIEYNKHKLHSDIIEYITAEILEISGHNTRDHKRNTICEYDVYKIILLDDELKHFLIRDVPIIKILDFNKDEYLNVYTFKYNKTKIINKIKDNGISLDVGILEFIFDFMLCINNFVHNNVNTFKDKFKLVVIDDTREYVHKYHEIILDIILTWMNDHNVKKIYLGDMFSAIKQLKDNNILDNSI